MKKIYTINYLLIVSLVADNSEREGSCGGTVPVLCHNVVLPSLSGNII